MLKLKYYIGCKKRFAPKSTRNKNKTRPRIKQDTSENKEKYVEQLFKGRETLQRNEPQAYYRK